MLLGLPIVLFSRDLELFSWEFGNENVILTIYFVIREYVEHCFHITSTSI